MSCREIYVIHKDKDQGSGQSAAGGLLPNWGKTCEKRRLKEEMELRSEELQFACLLPCLEWPVDACLS